MSSARLSAQEQALHLRDFIAGEIGADVDAVSVNRLRRLAGGASRLLWAVDVEIPGANGEAEAQSLELVLRQDPPGRISEGGMELEFELLRAAAACDVPVPAVYWCTSNHDVLGSPFFAMERIRGEAIARRLLRDDKYAVTRKVLAAELGRILARVHRIDPEAPALSGRLTMPPEGKAPSRVEIDRIADGVRLFAIEPHPVLELAERWLRERAPDPPRLGFVHGDYRVGNVMFDESGTRAILDWELAHVGDPVEDLGWLCVRAWRFGNDDLPVGGVGTREELVAAYEEAGGESVDSDALRFWEACGNYKLALVFITQARAFLDGAHATVELAALGRRIVEAEDELLRLMEGD